MLAKDIYGLLEGSASAAFVITLNGEICFWNTAARRLFGYPSQDVLNRSVSQVLVGKGALGTLVYEGEYSVQQCASRTLSIPAFDLQVKTHSGKWIWVNITTLVFEDQRTGCRLIAHLAHDISDRKKKEQAFTRLTEIAKEIAQVSEGPARLAPAEPLSEKEERILKLFADARTTTQVARALGITLPTLRNHLHLINRKLRTHSRLEAVIHAKRRGII